MDRVFDPRSGRTFAVRCPHLRADRIQDCPLYRAGHAGGDGHGLGHGCVDDMVGPCRVDRGVVDFETARTALIRSRFAALRLRLVGGGA